MQISKLEESPPPLLLVQTCLILGKKKDNLFVQEEERLVDSHSLRQTRDTFLISSHIISHKISITSAAYHDLK